LRKELVLGFKPMDSEIIEKSVEHTICIHKKGMTLNG